MPETRNRDRDPREKRRDRKRRAKRVESGYRKESLAKHRSQLRVRSTVGVGNPEAVPRRIYTKLLLAKNTKLP
ncbi:hypothetical protein NDU88_000374 [Pleurodeles waltl]|uniref:Uncharacterized protein n=1 Tax=Pleurodeles waltl TaxID=8319 RepID=A0AAV7WL72_PLEWA|nr:hypothetical protein NDU88_000374 [Pleurodeles waltl]